MPVNPPMQQCSSAPTRHTWTDFQRLKACVRVEFDTNFDHLKIVPVQSTAIAKKGLGNADKPMYVHLVCVKIITHDVDMCQDN